jgi:nucleoside-diphosphate-sugar epimerase|tara:strand:- start:3594 stop:4607 length:1014 start_codon:yes stop_codon:yes gene_type:complete
MEINSLKNKKVLIIGGGGFIGHNLALELKNRNGSVEIIDSLEVNNYTSVLSNKDDLPFPELSLKILDQRIKLLKKKNIPLHVLDARNYHSLSHKIDEIKPNVIVHLAAVSHANRSNKDPHSTFDHSLRTLENALDNSKNKIDHFIYFSSSMVYGNFEIGHVDEKTECNPIGIYGALKFSGEKMVIAYNQVFDLPYTIVRPSALYGERCISRRVGQIFIENAIYNKPIKINGDGSEKLDFTYIKDLVNGVINIIENKNSYNEIFNLTYGSARPILDLVEILNEYFPNIKIEKVKKDVLMPERGTLSNDKIKDLLGFNSSWPIDEGYRDYIDWYLSLKN